MNEIKILAFNLKRHRQFKGLKQEDLAKKVGLTKYTISNIELGKQENVGLKYLISICRELDVGLEELFMKNPDSFSLKLVISDKNFQALKRLGGMFKKAIESE